MIITIASMKNFSNRFRLIVLALSVAVTALFMSSCSMVADSTLGSDIMPEGQVMVMRHLKYQGNTKISFNADAGVNVEEELDNLIETRLYRSDSLVSSNLGVGYMGVRRSDVFGQRTAGFASTMLYMNALDEDNGFGYMPIFDTMKLVLTVKEYGGDTLVPIRYQVFELQKSLSENALTYNADRGDTIAFINIDLEKLGMYDPNKPIFEFTFPNSELGEGPATVMIPMENTPYSWDFARRLMLVPDDYATNTEWDGYGRSGIEIYSDDSKWLDKFHGLYIKPIEDLPANKEGAMYALDLTASGIMLQGRSRNPKDPAMIKDTVGMYYYFKDESSAVNASVNKINRDYSISCSGGASQLNGVVMDYTKPREERTELSTCYVEGMGGPATEIYFTDAFLNELLSIGKLNEEESGSKIGINQCLMSIYVKGADYDWNVTQAPGNAVDFATMYESAFTRFGTYRLYDRFAAIPDYDYLYEESNGTVGVYDGCLDRSRGCYVINLTSYMQRLYNEAKKALQEDGSYQFPDPYGVGNINRSIYVGVEATNPFSFAESTLQGMVDASGENKAPIQIDLTYTIIK